MKLLYNIFD